MGKSKTISQGQRIASTSEAIAHLSICKGLLYSHYKSNSVYLEAQKLKGQAAESTEKVMLAWGSTMAGVDTLLAAYEATLEGLLDESKANRSKD